MDHADGFLRGLFEDLWSVAVVGMSRDPAKPSHFVPAYLLEHGYEVIPVNPGADEILGLPSFPSLDEVDRRVDLVQVFRPSEDVPALVDRAVARKEARGDLRALWLQEGIRNDEAAERARQAGLVVVQDRCMKKVHERLFGDGSKV